MNDDILDVCWFPSPVQVLGLEGRQMCGAAVWPQRRRQLPGPPW